MAVKVLQMSLRVHVMLHEEGNDTAVPQPTPSNTSNHLILKSPLYDVISYLGKRVEDSQQYNQRSQPCSYLQTLPNDSLRVEGSALGSQLNNCP
jgi:hypothetical protein